MWSIHRLEELYKKKKKKEKCNMLYKNAKHTNQLYYDLHHCDCNISVELPVKLWGSLVLGFYEGSVSH